MATVLKLPEDDIRELNEAEAREFFEAAVRRRLHISATEFLKKLDAGQFRGKEEDPKIMSLLSLLPLVR